VTGAELESGLAAFRDSTGRPNFSRRTGANRIRKCTIGKRAFRLGSPVPNRGDSLRSGAIGIRALTFREMKTKSKKNSAAVTAGETLVHELLYLTYGGGLEGGDAGIGARFGLQYTVPQRGLQGIDDQTAAASGAITNWLEHDCGKIP
jgi:hypothetical protein